MAKAVQDNLELPLAGGGVLRIKNSREAATWLSQLQEDWKWFFTNQQTNSQNLNQTRTALQNLLNKLANTDLNGDGWDQQIRNNVLAIFPLGSPLGPADPVVEQLRQTTRALGSGAEWIAVACYLTAERLAKTSQIDQALAMHPLWFRAQAIAFSRRYPVDSGGRAASDKQIVVAGERLNSLLAESATQIKRDQDSADELRKRLDQEAREVAERFNDAATDTIDRLLRTEQQYAEVMRLKAPVDYWAAKGDQHRNSVRTYRRWMTGLAIGFLPVMGLVYSAGWFALDRFATQHSGQAVAMTIYVAGFVGAITAVGLWFIRIVVRLYMSQHHLSADADERASLLRTYLALTQSGKVSEEERALVLTAIFRPVPDGIIKDDGGPVLNPAGLLAAILERK